VISINGIMVRGFLFSLKRFLESSSGVCRNPRIGDLIVYFLSNYDLNETLIVLRSQPLYVN
jgi:hypothetical protein